MQKIRVTVDIFGSVTTEAIGFEGEQCRQATEPFRKAINASEGSRSEVIKPEFYNETTQDVAQTQAG